MKILRGKIEKRQVFAVISWGIFALSLSISIWITFAMNSAGLKISDNGASPDQYTWLWPCLLMSLSVTVISLVLAIRMRKPGLIEGRDS